MTPPAETPGLSPIASYNENNSRTSLIGSETSNNPIGIRLFGSCFQFSSPASKRTYHKALVLLMTFIAYAAFHMGRRPLSVVKNVLNRNCSAHNHTNDYHLLLDDGISNVSNNHSNIIEFSVIQNQNDNLINGGGQAIANDDDCHSWAPFDDDSTANQLLATLDSSFLLAYAIFMFVSGIVAERMNLRYFITIGTILSGFGLVAFGLAKPFEIHSLSYFIVIQIISGAAQTTGWPVVVTCVGNWFGPAKRGLIYGFWNSHTSLGNILGAVLAGVFVEDDWGLSFIVPGGIMVIVGILLFMFLVPTPADVYLPKESSPTDKRQQRDVEAQRQPTALSSTSSTATSTYDAFNQSENGSSKSISTSQEHNQQSTENHKAVSFFKALTIPGVIEYSLCLFFSKLVSYTFLYWLPRYIKSSTSFDSEESAYLSVPFDIGGIAGGILAGYFSDKFRASGITCIAMLLLAIPSMFAYQAYGALSSLNNVLLQLVVGTLVNGPYCLITTAVSADLGTRIKDGRAMATVSGIIDGMGSVGAVLGPLFAGFASNSGNWQAVFFMLMASDVLASLCLIRVTYNEIRNKVRRNNIRSQ